MKFKKGDKVKIIGCSCRNPQDCNGCKIFKELPYMVVKHPNYDNNKIYIMTKNEEQYKGHVGCSGFKEKDLILLKPTLRAFLEKRR